MIIKLIHRWVALRHLQRASIEYSLALELTRLDSSNEARRAVGDKHAILIESALRLADLY